MPDNTFCESAKIAGEYSIVLFDSGAAVLPVEIVGLRDKENLFAAADRTWQGNSIHERKALGRKLTVINGTDRWVG